MSALVVGLSATYAGLAIAGLMRTRLLEVMVLQPFRELLPMMIKGFWDVYPGRFWPGPLKLLGYPLTLAFLATVAILFTLFQVFLVVAISPKLIWWLFRWRPPVQGAPA
jgi:hypothetical protein